jgi:hypothetical protein
MKRIFLTVTAVALMLAASASPAVGATEHCPSGGVKTESGPLNAVVLPTGTQFCVKGSTDATGILTSDGETTLVEYLNNGHDVSYYVIYGGQPSTTPTTPSPTISLSPTPTTSTATPSPSSVPSPVSSPTTPAPTPSESDAQTGTPSLTPPPTDTTIGALVVDDDDVMWVVFFTALVLTMAYISRSARGTR